MYRAKSSIEPVSTMYGEVEIRRVAGAAGDHGGGGGGPGSFSD